MKKLIRRLHRDLSCFVFDPKDAAGPVVAVWKCKGPNWTFPKKFQVSQYCGLMFCQLEYGGEKGEKSSRLVSWWSTAEALDVFRGNFADDLRLFAEPVVYREKSRRIADDDRDDRIWNAFGRLAKTLLTIAAVGGVLGTFWIQLVGVPKMVTTIEEPIVRIKPGQHDDLSVQVRNVSTTAPLHFVLSEEHVKLLDEDGNDVTAENERVQVLEKFPFAVRVEPVSYTHLTLPTRS